MRAVGLDYANQILTHRDVPKPRRTLDNEVLLRVLEVGVCGTDRELSSFLTGYPPVGEDFLILGHEAVGQVIEAGPAVVSLRPGDWVVPMIRRACDPPCASCARGRRDLCLTGGFRERGIFGVHGYFAEYAVDDAQDLVAIPPELVDHAVLLEPLSVVEKAVETALRLHPVEPVTALVLGAGPVGILAAMAFAARGLKVAVHSLEPAADPRARLLESAGIRYLTALEGGFDIVLEAAGSFQAALAGLRAMNPAGVCCVLGAPNSGGDFPFRDLILKNQTVFGSVNASPQAFDLALRDLASFDPAIVRRLIRRVGFSDYHESILGPPGDAPKLVHVIE
jgi:threonine dehydrogenase-like Zn-dependent dehydrogenase